MMNEDDIQPSTSDLWLSKSCGLVMNEDDIQLAEDGHCNGRSCGLVMNEDDIQRSLQRNHPLRVVVW